MTTTIGGGGSGGRFGNHLIRNLATSMIAEKNNLHVTYSYHEDIRKLGIELFVGEKKHEKFMVVNNDNIADFFEYDDLECNLMIEDTFQTKEATNEIYKYLNRQDIKTKIMEKNPYNERYNNNQDCFVHLRLDDAIYWNPGFVYYDKAISSIPFDQLYISSDQIEHDICKKIIEKYPTTKIIDYDKFQTIQFASTNKHIILSHGSFSACIGYLGFYSNVYYPMYEAGKMWYGDMFSIPGWNCIEY